jgi:hypothetical protein
MYAIAVRDSGNHVLFVVSMDGRHVWTTTEEARNDGYEVLYR